MSGAIGGAASTVVFKCCYHCDGLQAWKENAQGRTYFLYDDDQLVAEFDSSGVMQASQTWGAEGLSYRRTASGASAGNRFYSWDVRGNIAATTDSTGAIVNTPASDGFSSSGGVESCATFGGQVGGYQDAETGLILFGRRYYDSSLGSWLTRDPMAENGGINLYSYVQGNPANRLDPSGLITPEEILKGLGEAAASVAVGVETFGVGTLLGDQKAAGDPLNHEDTMTGRLALEHTFRARLRAKSGFRPTGRIYIVDEGCKFKQGGDFVQTLRDQGYNVRSSRGIFGRDPGDDVIGDLARNLGGRVITKDRGTKGGGFGDLAINIPDRVRTTPDALRIVLPRLRK